MGIDELMKAKNNETDRHLENCLHCAKPMFVANGKVHKLRQPKTGKFKMVKFPDQEAKYHSGCRKEARRLARKEYKKNIKENK